MLHAQHCVGAASGRAEGLPISGSAHAVGGHLTF